MPTEVELGRMSTKELGRRLEHLVERNVVDPSITEIAAELKERCSNSFDARAGESPLLTLAQVRLLRRELYSGEHPSIWDQGWDAAIHHIARWLRRLPQDSKSPLED